VRSGSIQVRRVKQRQVKSGLRTSLRTAAAAALSAVLLAGCASKAKQTDAQPVDLNAFPQNYRKQVAVYLSLELSERADFRGAQISQPVLKPVGGDSPRYVVCVIFNPRSRIKPKMVFFLAAQINQFVDATPEQCSDAVYQPFAELEQTVPDK
jgi:hypothetical protein